MAKGYDDDEVDYKSYKPGNIDRDLFEMDDEDYDVDTSSIDENYEDDEEVEGEESTLPYEFDASEEESNENDEQTFKDLIEGEEETTENLETSNFDPAEELMDEPKKEAEQEVKSVEEIDPDLVNVMNKIEENNKTENISEESSSEEEKIEETPVEEKVEDSEEVIEDKVEEKEEVQETEEKEVEVHNSDEIKIVENTNDTEIDIKCRQDLFNSFKEKVESYYKRYKEQDLVNYINDFIDKDDNRHFFSDTFIMQYCKYSLAINFQDPVALQNLWVLVAGMFADDIEEKKRNNIIESSVVNEYSKDPDNVDIIEDDGIRSVKEFQRNQNEKYAQYKLDRTVFNISDSTDEENCSIFDDKRTLDKDFYESEFYKIHKEILTSDRSADMSKVFSMVVIDERSSYVPIIDYSTGVRLICIDTNDTDQYRLNPLIISRKVPFSFKGFNNRTIKTRILYLDDCVSRPVAVISSLKKLIGYKFYKDKYKIRLSRNYVIAYTTEPRWVDMFEKGDPDSHKPENSTYSMSKPSNMTIGVIVLDKKTENDRRAIRRNQIVRDVGQYEPPAADDYNIQFVLSARITKNDLRLRNPAIPRNERYVEYVITQYNECNPVIILDGLQIILSCIINEHKNTYSPGTPYSISLEYDRDGLISPAVVAMLDERDGLEPALNQRNNPNEIDAMYIMPPSRRKMEGVYDFECGRIDKRYFSPMSIQRKYDRSLWSNYDLATRDGRIQFIRSRGFEEFLHNKPIQFDVMPYALNMIESSETIRDIIKVSLTMLSDRNSADTEAILTKQAELNYKKSLGDTKAGKFHLMLLEAANFIIDTLAQKNNSTTTNFDL